MRPPQHWKNLVPRNAAVLLKQSGRGAVPAKTMRAVAVLFVDIEGCTRLCEDLPPRAMNEIREAYFSKYLDIVRATGGEVTEILGDGLLALFEGPDHPVRPDLTGRRVSLDARESEEA